MNTPDLVLFAILGVSAILGALRGFLGVVVSTASWLLAGWIAFQFGDRAAQWLAGGGDATAAQLFGGYALTFIAVLTTVAVFGLLLKLAVKATEATALDKGLGFGLGVVRGVAIAAVLVLVMGFTPLREDPDWQASQAVQALQPAAAWMRTSLSAWPQAILPDDSSTAAASGDNAHDPAALPQPIDAPGAAQP